MNQVKFQDLVNNLIKEYYNRFKKEDIESIIVKKFEETPLHDYRGEYIVNENYGEIFVVEYNRNSDGQVVSYIIQEEEK